MQPPTVPTDPRSARDRWIVVGIVLCYIVVASTGIISTRGQRGMNPESGWLLSGGLVALIALLLTRTSLFAAMEGRWAERTILLVSVFLQSLVLVLHWPLLSDDVTRYRFDGRQWIDGRNAYAMTPAKAIDSGLADPIDALTPHRETTALYLPTSQLTFATIAAIERAVLIPTDIPQTDWRRAQPSLSWLERAGIWRATSALLAVGCVAILLRLLRQLHRSPWWATLFAWHPLVLIETAGNAHQDVLGILLMMLGILLTNTQRQSVSCIATAFAVFVKPIAILPALAGLRLGDRRSLRIAILLVTLLGLGGAVTYAMGRDAILDSMHRYGTTWEFNGGPFEWFKWLMIETLGFEANGMKQHLRRAGGLLVVGVAILLWRRKSDPISLSAWVMATSCLVSPVLYPWYLLWPLTLVATGTPAARWTILTWSATSVLSYAVLRETQWILPARIVWIEYMPVIVALIADGVIAWNASRGVANDPDRPLAT